MAACQEGPAGETQVGQHSRRQPAHTTQLGGSHPLLASIARRVAAAHPCHVRRRHARWREARWRPSWRASGRWPSGGWPRRWWLLRRLGGAARRPLRRTPAVGRQGRRPQLARLQVKLRTETGASSLQTSSICAAEFAPHQPTTTPLTCHPQSRGPAWRWQPPPPPASAACSTRAPCPPPWRLPCLLLGPGALTAAATAAAAERRAAAALLPCPRLGAGTRP